MVAYNPLGHVKLAQAQIKAVAHRHGLVAVLLLEKGADPNARDEEEGTALMDAASSYPTLVRPLISAGGSVNAQNIRGESPLPLAAWFGKTEAVKALVENGANLECRDEKGNTALMNAALNGRAKTIKLLLENGANPNARNADCESVLSISEKSKNWAVVRLLERADAHH